MSISLLRLAGSFFFSVSDPLESDITRLFFDSPTSKLPERLLPGERDIDPLLADPLRADPLLADPLLADPLRADPLRADPLRADLLRADLLRLPDFLEVFEPPDRSECADRSERERDERLSICRFGELERLSSCAGEWLDAGDLDGERLGGFKLGEFDLKLFKSKFSKY